MQNQSRRDNTILTVLLGICSIPIVVIAPLYIMSRIPFNQLDTMQIVIGAILFTLAGLGVGGLIAGGLWMIWRGIGVPIGFD